MGSKAHLVRALYDAFARRDAEAMLGSLAHDIIWNEAEGNPYANGNPYEGPREIAEGVFRRLMTEWSGFSIHPEATYEDGETVVAVGHYTGTHRETGRRIKAQFAHVWTIRHGRVVRFQQYTDTLQLSEASGLAVAASV